MKLHTKLILHPTDFSDNAAKALKFSLEFLDIPTTRLLIMHVIEVPPGGKSLQGKDAIETIDEREAMVMQQMDQYILRCCGKLAIVPVPDREIIQSTIAYKGILDTIKRLDPFMVVMGQIGTSAVKNIVMGSNTARLLEKSGCPILTVPSKMDI
jgi:nucleotide-binding universal stress UspA family protein